VGGARGGEGEMDVGNARGGGGARIGWRKGVSVCVCGGGIRVKRGPWIPCTRTSGGDSGPVGPGCTAARARSRVETALTLPFLVSETGGSGDGDGDKRRRALSMAQQWRWKEAPRRGSGGVAGRVKDSTSTGSYMKFSVD
jgi:hypothetical protein